MITATATLTGKITATAQIRSVQTGSCADATVTNQAETYSQVIPSGDTEKLPYGLCRDSDGSDVQVDYKPTAQGYIFQATLCVAPSLSVATSNATPTYGQTVTITVTPTAMTPTQYTFTVVGNITTTVTVQAGNAFSYQVDTVNPTIYIQAEGGGLSASTVYNGLTVASITEADAAITAIEAAYSATMGGRQKDAINLLAWMFEGNGTTNGTDLWTLLNATSAVMYLYCPINDTTAAFAGYAVDFLTPAHSGSFANMVSGDLSVRGITGGATKYFNQDVRATDFDQNSIMLHAYQSEYQFEYLTTPFGAHESTEATLGISAFWQFNNIQGIIRVNSSANASRTKQSTTGILSVGRSASNEVAIGGNGKIDATAATASTGRADFDIYGHGFHNGSTGAVAAPSSNRYAGFAVTPWLTANEYLDFCEAWDAFNKIVIPNGRRPRIG